MCSPASMIVTKNKVHWLPWCDSHEEIIKKYGLNDTGRDPGFVRVEITPENNDYRIPHDKWGYRVDQDYLPDWYNPIECESAARAELPAWYEKHIITEGKHEIDGSLCRDLSVIVLGGEVTITGQTGGNCLACGNATLNATGQTGGNCRAWDNATLNKK